jgi:hypothetical protein
LGNGNWLLGLLRFRLHYNFVHDFGYALIKTAYDYLPVFRYNNKGLIELRQPYEQRILGKTEKIGQTHNGVGAHGERD